MGIWSAEITHEMKAERQVTLLGKVEILSCNALRKAFLHFNLITMAVFHKRKIENYRTLFKKLFTADYFCPTDD